ncbi:MAG: hypothetical protein ABR526_07020 [Chthoniobacterales bacterium]
MQLLPQEKPAPRLLNTVVPDTYGAATAPPDAKSPSALLKGALFSGNGLAIFIGLILGCFLVAGAGWLYARHTRAERDRLVAAQATSDTLPSAGNEASPAPTMVQISPDNIRVTAISLGEPRLAVINGHQVGEGDSLSLATPDARYQVELRVTKITDGGVALSDGVQTIVARLAVVRRAEDNLKR